LKILINLIVIFYSKPLIALEIIRDPIFENYFNTIEEDQNINNVYLLKSDTPNAFVMGDYIYFTTDLLKIIEDEDALKSIYYHELGHIKNNHHASKKINLEKNKKNQLMNNILSVGMAIISQNPNLGLASSLTLDQNLINKLSKNSINYEIQADNYMLKMIEKNNLNTKGLINFFKHVSNQKKNYFQSHPRPIDRINILKRYSKDKNKKNSIIFEFLKAKYGNNSNIENLNFFFQNLELGINTEKKLEGLVDKSIIKYELYKHGFLFGQNEEVFLELMKINNNTYLKIEFFNYIIDTNLTSLYHIIENEKYNSVFRKEYFYFYLMGKYYDKINNHNLSNFYFCQFYQLTKSKNKSNYYCMNYNKDNISQIDSAYALFK
jgi:hypothetical protein